jgi:hypothetical protein
MVQLRSLSLCIGLIVVVSLGLATLPAAAGPPALEAPAEADIAEGRRLVAAMKANDRGPYFRIRWFCADGTVLPPQPYACRDHGGGHQHAEYSADRRRLAELGWPAGTIVTATAWEEIWEPGRSIRLQQLLVERYLVEVDDGWVLRRARFYRGRVQVEDEESTGRAHLIRLLSQPQWLAGHFLLARETVRALPHHGGADRTLRIRHTSQELAEKDRSFESLRIKIHTAPGAGDIEATRQWLETARKRGLDPGLQALALELIDELEKLYGSSGAWLVTARKALARDSAWPELASLLTGLTEVPQMERLARSAAAMARIRDLAGSSTDGARNLALLDLSLAIERELNRDAFTYMERPAMTRGELTVLARHLVAAVYGCGLLSQRERDAVAGPLQALGPATSAHPSAYLDATRSLRRVPGWCLGTVRHAFAEAMVGYGALEPKAYRFQDDLLRGSAMLPLAEVTTSLVADADRLHGVAHRLFGERYGGLVGLNPGVAAGRLRVVTRAELDGHLTLQRDEIVVLPQTASELTPVAGILTLAEGNLLSHVQLLARNLGIPNASLSPALKDALTAHDGKQVIFAVSSDGSVVIEELDAVPEEVRHLAVNRSGALPGARIPVDAPQPDLAVRRPIPLAELRSDLAGLVVGPKAANLGELAHTFPGRVEQAIALPFGVFADHTGRGDESAKLRLDRAYHRYRAGELDHPGLMSEIAVVCQQIVALELSPELRRQLLPMMEKLFGEPGSYGLFVRSDTNVEDLPGFTGAGLNETIANVVDPAAQLRAIARVWASPFRERAVAWRAPLLTRPEEVYTSVLLMKSVPADKSGVMITTDLVRRRPGLTVATSWGVGGAVDGDAAETVILEADGGTTLIGEAKAPYRRRLQPGGGVEWVPAPSGRVLTDSEQEALRELAAEVAARLEPVVDTAGQPLPWDIELGFVKGSLQLFQIRPLIERGATVADRVISRLTPGGGPEITTVKLDVEIPVRSVPMDSVTR